MSAVHHVAGSRAWLAMLASITMAGVLFVTIISPALPDAARAFSASYEAVQWSVSLPMLTVAVALVFIGPLADRFGRRPVLLVALGLFSIGGLLSAIAWSPGVLVTARMVQAAGACAAAALPRVIVCDSLTGLRAVRTMSLISGFYALAPAIGQLAGAYLVAFLGWRAPMTATAVLGIVLVAWVWLSYGESLEIRARMSMMPAGLWSQYRQLLVDRSFRAYCAICAGSQAGFLALLVYAPRRCILDFGISTETFGWLIGLGAGTYFVGTMLSMKLAAKMGILRLIGTGATVMAAGLALLVLVNDWQSANAVVIPMALYCLGHGLSFPNAMYGALQVDKTLAGSASAMVGVVMFAGAMLASAVAGSLATSNIGAAVVIGACAGFVGIGLAAVRSTAAQVRAIAAMPQPEKARI